MNDWDKLLVAIVGLALVAVLLATGQTASAITQIGGGFVQLTKNIVGGYGNAK